MGNLKELNFNSTWFVDLFGDRHGLDMNPLNYKSMYGSLIGIPGTTYYLHLSNTTNSLCLQKSIRSLILVELLNKHYDSIENLRLGGDRFSSLLAMYDTTLSRFAGPKDARVFIDGEGSMNVIFNMREQNQRRAFNLSREFS